MSEILTGTVLDFPYTGAVETITLPKGKYKLECWGAQGGSYSTAYGGRGGYVSGVLELQAATDLFIRAGGQPQTVSTVQQTVPGGFNGGGNGYCRSYSGTSTYGQGGGGASDIRIGKDSLYARVAVAGGGGGSAQVDAAATKYGGGASGGSPQSGYGATQTAAGTNGSFGQGASCSQSGHNYKYGSGGGGGGWYGGGSVNSYHDSTDYRGYNGGGSGFVWTGLNAPTGYLLTEEHYLTETQNLPGNTAFAAPDGTTETGHGGNGYVRITELILRAEPPTPQDLTATLKTDSVLTLSWSASADAFGYRVYKSGAMIADTADTFLDVDVHPFFGALFSVSAYNEVGESKATELLYFYAPEGDFALQLITDRTAQDVAARNSKGSYTAKDLNRVGYAVRYLADRLEAVGVHVDVEPVYIWTDTEWATPSAMEPYLEQVRIMRNALTLAYAPAVPDDMQQLTFSEANDIESVLLALDSHIKAMVSSVDAGWATGTAYTGFYFKEAD